ncbi:uncharacterized protein [Littorina saxatilis]|uniref:THD domain-containing protein n=1 Tax=Littorina saxatilis TaxID=31220 RepID=A0AAN9APN2_9CAEN
MTETFAAPVCYDLEPVVFDDGVSTVSSAPYAETVTKAPHTVPQSPPPYQAPYPHRVDPDHNNGSNPYAETLTPGFTKTKKAKRLKRQQGQSYPPLENRAIGDHARHAEKLMNSKRKLKIWTKRFTWLLVVMVILWIGPVIPLVVRYPFVLGKLKQFMPGTGEAGALDGTQRCDTVTQNFQKDLLGKCGISPTDVCSMDVKTALCLLTKTKENLDERTVQLDRSVYEQINTLTKKIENETHSLLVIRNISAIYSQRPSVYLHLYYSHENVTAYQSSNTFDPLRWTRGKRGQETVRGMEVSFVDRAYATEVKVTQGGYYYLYSHVTFEAPPHTSKQNRHVHVFKNHGRNGTRTRLLDASHVHSSKDHVSYMQGIFMLRAGDTLSVIADIQSVNKARREDTFFGVFQI